MSVLTKNPFELLNEGDDEGIVPVKETKKEASPPKKESAVKAAAVEKKGEAPGPTTGKETRGPKRQFDRRSGTGRGRAADGAEDKRGGFGKYNWGAKESGTTPEDVAQDVKEQTEDQKESAEAALEKKEEEQMSLDEYLAKKAKDAAEGLAELKVREVEKIDMKGLKPIDRDEDDAFAVGESKGNKGKKSIKSGRKEQVVVDDKLLGFKTAPMERSDDRPIRDGGKGGRSAVRGGGRCGDRREGGRGRGGGGGGGAPAVNLADDSAFPSL